MEPDEGQRTLYPPMGADPRPIQEILPHLTGPLTRSPPTPSLKETAQIISPIKTVNLTDRGLVRRDAGVRHGVHQASQASKLFRD